MEDVLVSWSGGKDSCLALYKLQQAGRHRVAALLTTVTKDYAPILVLGAAGRVVIGLSWQVGRLNMRALRPEAL